MTTESPGTGHHAHTPLTAAELHVEVDPARFPFETTDQVEALVGIIGQDRALSALQVGLELDAPGFNLFLSGLRGNGRATAVQAHLKKVRPYCPLARDRAYVFNFKDPRRPRLLTFPRGRASQFSREMDQLVLGLVRELRPLLSSEEAHTRLAALKGALAERKDRDLRTFNEKLATQGFRLDITQDEAEESRYALLVQVPGVEGLLAEESLGEAVAKKIIDQKTAGEMAQRFAEHTRSLRSILRRHGVYELDFMRELATARQEICAPFIDLLLETIRKQFPEDDVQTHLDALREDLFEQLAVFVQFAAEQQQLPEVMTPEIEAAFYRYRVNVILDNREREGCPVVVESQPTFTRLFGGVERPAEGEPRGPADFLHLRAGSLLEADGGYLILDAQDVLRARGVWSRLKATLRARQLEIPESDSENRRATVIDAQTIPINVKVLLIGSFDMYQNLVIGDPDFQQIFKVRVDFDQDMPATDELLEQKIPALIRRLCDQEQLRPLNRGAVAATLARAIRWAERQNRVSSVFTRLADLVREADYWANRRGVNCIEAEDVRQAVCAVADRAGLPEEHSRRATRDGTVLVSTEGAEVGQVNALVVRSIGTDAFGLPVRITAQVGMGTQGVISIEREVGLSGETHEKGVQILSGYLRGQYAQEHPLSLAASICFEQSYGGVDGDSATITEIYAIISALTGIPLRQDLAVTGSMNQRGDVQAVGGLNEKIEGFFRLAEERGFAGEPGVIVPRASVQQLNLAAEVIEAVRTDRFRVYAIEHVDEGLELLTGIPAGYRRSDGTYPQDTLHYLTDQKLKALARGLAGFR